MASLPPGASSQLLCTFQLACWTYAVDVLDVKEIHAATACTRIPHAPPAVLGYVNLRGQIYLILDLRRLLNLEAAAVDARSRFIIFKPAVGQTFGVLVDRIGDMVTVPTDRQEPVWPAVAGSGEAAAEAGDLLAGFAKLDDKLAIVLHARRFLPRIEQALARADDRAVPDAAEQGSLSR